MALKFWKPEANHSANTWWSYFTMSRPCPLSRSWGYKGVLLRTLLYHQTYIQNQIFAIMFTIVIRVKNIFDSLSFCFTTIRRWMCFYKWPFKKYVTQNIEIFDPPIPCHTWSPFNWKPLPLATPQKVKIFKLKPTWPFFFVLIS